jgi:restriction system protein
MAMAEITRERQGQMVRKAFEILNEHPEGLPAREVIARVERDLGLTPFESSHYPTNPRVRRFDKIIRFSTIAAVKAGWLVKEKGRWTLTEAGQAAYRQFRDPESFMRESVRLYRAWRRDQPPDESEADELDSETPGAATTLEEAEENAWAEIEAHLGKLNPYDFQELVAGLLNGMGYHVSWVAPAGPDKGVDIIAHKDPLGVERRRIKVQVKRRADKVSVVEVRSFMAVLGDEDVGIFVTTAGFTGDAENEARLQEKRRIMLLDAKRLFDLWVQHYEQVPEEKRRLLPLRTVRFLAPDE